MPAGNRGAVGPPAGPMDIDGPQAPGQRRRAGRKQPASPTAASQPLSPTSPTAAEAAAAALSAAAERSGGGSGGAGPSSLRADLVPLPDQLQLAIDAAMSSGGLGAWPCYVFLAVWLAVGCAALPPGVTAQHFQCSRPPHRHLIAPHLFPLGSAQTS